MNKILSIVVIVYNGAKFLPKLFSSIKENDDVEIIIVNDGSTDNSLEVIEDYIKDKKNMYVYTKENGGQSTARNLGIQKARGKYILFADCDDYFTDDAFEIMLDTLKNKSDLYVFDFYKIVNSKTKESWINLPNNGNFKLDTENIVRDCLNGKMNDLIAPSLWNKVFKKSIIIKHNIKFIKGQKLYEDMFFNLEYLTHCDSMYINNSVIYNYVIHANSITRCFKTWLIKSLENIYNIVPQISKKYKYNKYEKYLMKLIIPYTLTLIRNESQKEFKEGLTNLKNFFSSKRTIKYLNSIDKSCLTTKEKLYYFLIKLKLYKILYVIYYLKNKNNKNK